MNHCSKCGAPLSPGAVFCARCGTPVQQAAAARKSRWWIFPAALVALVAVTWLVLAGMPFGGNDDPPAAPKVETVAEAQAAPAQQQSGTLIEVETAEEDVGGTPQTPPPATAPAP